MPAHNILTVKRYLVKHNIHHTHWTVRLFSLSKSQICTKSNLVQVCGCMKVKAMTCSSARSVGIGEEITFMWSKFFSALLYCHTSYDLVMCYQLFYIGISSSSVPIAYSQHVLYIFSLEHLCSKFGFNVCFKSTEICKNF